MMSRNYSRKITSEVNCKEVKKIIAEEYENVLFCNIQIQLKQDDSLSSYYNQVKNGNYEFPSYSNSCPICSGIECCKFHGKYFREVIDEHGTYFKEFPILRFICNGKGNKKCKGKTFSLLPYQLIPYVKYSIDYLSGLLFFWESHSIKDTLDKVSLDTNQILDIKSLYRYKEIFEKGINILLFSELINKHLSLSDFLSYCFAYQSRYFEQIRGSPALGLDYYIYNGSYFRNSWFLFGVASQFR